MKISFLMTGLLGLATVTAFAQKGELSTAQAEFGKYEVMRPNKAKGTMALTSLNTAKTSIDKASTNEKTKDLPLTYALKGAIYASIAVNDTVPATSTPNYVTAEEALKKAKEVDTKGENKKMIDDAQLALAQYQQNKGVKEYGKQDYELAYKSFDSWRQMYPEDTTATYYTGLAAANAAQKNPAFIDPAIANFTKLTNTNFSKRESLYNDISNFYMEKKDTAAAIKTMTQASEKFPNNAAIGKKVIEMNLVAGKQNEVLSKIESTIAKDPKNKTLYYYAGITYTQVADAAAAKLKTAKDAATIASLTKTRDDNYKAAEDKYHKALEIDPDYFEGNLNLGYILINPAIDLYNAANKLPANQQKQYDAAIAKSNALFDTAKPYLQKAVDLKPNSIDALTNLRTYYLGKKDTAHASEIKKKIEDLQANPPAK